MQKRFILLLMILLISVLVNASDSCETFVWTDKEDYPPGDTVLISGVSYNPNSNIDVFISRPDDVGVQLQTTSDVNGEFSNLGYFLDEENAMDGLYFVMATDGTNQAVNSFWDSGSGCVKKLKKYIDGVKVYEKNLKNGDVWMLPGFQLPSSGDVIAEYYVTCYDKYKRHRLDISGLCSDTVVGKPVYSSNKLVASCTYSGAQSGEDLILDLDVKVWGQWYDVFEHTEEVACVDMDEDGVCDNLDNCPNVYNPDQLDVNTNGIGDYCECTLIDFNDLNKGDIVTNQYSGVTLSATNQGGGPNIAMIFDSDNPSGGDPDLGTPNEDFGGPGRGTGGEQGQPGQNDEYLENLLIISEDGDSNDPDDEAGGGFITFDFANPVEMLSIKIVDLDETNNGHVSVYDSLNNLIKTVNFMAYGDNSLQNVIIDETGVAKMEVHFQGSGAVDNINYCDPCAGNEDPVIYFTEVTGCPPNSIDMTWFWDDDGIGIMSPLAYLYYTEDHINWIPITPGGIPASQIDPRPDHGSFLGWTPTPNTVAVAVAISEGCSDFDPPFSFPITQLTPTEGDVFTYGDEIFISWSITGIPPPGSEVQLGYSTDGGLTFMPIGTALASAGQFNWDTSLFPAFDGEIVLSIGMLAAASYSWIPHYEITVLAQASEIPEFSSVSFLAAVTMIAAIGVFAVRRGVKISDPEMSKELRKQEKALNKDKPKI